MARERAGLRRLVATGAACALIGGALPAFAADPASVVASGPTEQAAAIGLPFESELRVLVTDQWGAPVPGTTVVFTAPATGASAALSSTEAQTDEDGQASVVATANATVGRYTVTASVEGVATPVEFTLWNIPAGFRPGQQLASVTARDEKGKTRNIRDFLNHGHDYALIDVCASFCGPCRFMQQQAMIAFARLADRKIAVNLGALLMQGGVSASSTQADALAWKSDLSLPGPVLHSEGSSTSDLYQAAGFILGLPGGFPTSLLVAPDGTIIDRVVGMQEADQIEDRILRAVLTERPPLEATGADVTVTLGASSLIGTAAPSLTGPLGTATFESQLRGLLAEELHFQFEGRSPLPDSARVAMSPTWTDGYRRSSPGATVALGFLSVLDGVQIDLTNFVEFVSPLKRPSGSFSVAIDVAAFRTALASAIQPYVEGGEITQEEADGIVRDVYGVKFAVFVNIDDKGPKR